MKRVLLHTILLCLFSQLSMASTEKRLNFLMDTLEVSATDEKTWANLWGAAWVTVSAGQLIASGFIKDSKTKTELHVGAVNAAVGIIPTLIFRPRVIRDYEKFKSTTFQNQNEQITAAEEILAKDTDDKKLRRGWVAHTGNVLFNIGVSLLLSLHYKSHQAALISFVTGVPIGAFMIWSQPTSSIEKENIYYEKNKSNFTTSLFLQDSGAGLALSYVW